MPAWGEPGPASNRLDYTYMETGEELHVSTVRMHIPYFQYRYETAIFNDDTTERYKHRYLDVDSAQRGHNRIVDALRAGTRPEDLHLIIGDDQS